MGPQTHYRKRGKHQQGRGQGAEAKGENAPLPKGRGDSRRGSGQPGQRPSLLGTMGGRWPGGRPMAVERCGQPGEPPVSQG